jgi:fimbrial chaperone protein
MTLMTTVTGTRMAHPSHTLWACLAMAAGLALGQPAAAAAASFTVNPTRVFLSGKTRSALITLKNETEKPLRFQLSVVEWAQAPDGQMVLTPTRDVVFFPALLTLGAGEERKVRVGSEVTAGAIEKSYRLFVEELPPVEGSDAPNGVAMLTKMGIPIFIQPAKQTAQAALKDLVLKNGHLTFRLLNTGTVHYMPEGMRVRALDQSGAAVLDLKPNAWYVLAGGERVFDLPVPGDACSRVRSFQVEADLPGSTLKAALQAPDGACGK